MYFGHVFEILPDAHSGGSMGVPAAPPPQWDPILSFPHRSMFSPKKAHIGGWCPPPKWAGSPNGKSWIRSWLTMLHSIVDPFTPNGLNWQLAGCNRHIKRNHQSQKTELFKWV